MLAVIQISRSVHPNELRKFYSTFLFEGLFFFFKEAEVTLRQPSHFLILYFWAEVYVAKLKEVSLILSSSDFYKVRKTLYI